MLDGNYLVITEVTPEQYEALKTNSQKCQMILETEFEVWGEQDIPQFIQQALLSVVDESTEYGEWDRISDAPHDSYSDAVMEWPTVIKAQIMELCHISYDDGIAFPAFTLEEAQTLINAVPQIRNFFNTSSGRD